MTTFPNAQEKPFLSEILSGEVIPVEKLAYFRSRLMHRVHDLVLSEFDRLEDEHKISRAELARRIGRRPEQLTRWLNMPGNWTLDTLSDLLLGMGCEAGLSIVRLAEPVELRIVDTEPLLAPANLNRHAGVSETQARLKSSALLGEALVEKTNQPQPALVA